MKVRHFCGEGCFRYIRCFQMSAVARFGCIGREETCEHGYITAFASSVCADGLCALGSTLCEEHISFSVQKSISAGYCRNERGEVVGVKA